MRGFTDWGLILALVVMQGALGDLPICLKEFVITLDVTGRWASMYITMRYSVPSKVGVFGPVDMTGKNLCFLWGDTCVFQILAAVGCCRLTDLESKMKEFKPLW